MKTFEDNCPRYFPHIVYTVNMYVILHGSVWKNVQFNFHMFFFSGLTFIQSPLTLAKVINFSSLFTQYGGPSTDFNILRQIVYEL